MPNRRPSVPRAWYSFVAFLGAFLLFQLELIAGQFMLPLYGGGYQVWTACLLFFQGMLLLGYLYADLLPRKLAPRRFLTLHVGLLVAAAALMPVRFPDRPWLADPLADMMLRLLAYAGAPFFLLSATATVAQQAYARTPRGRSPYEIYGWSNLGSAAGLVSYPLAFAVAFGLEANHRLWRVLFAVFILAALPLIADAPEAGSAALPARAAPGADPRRFLWFLLPAATAAALVATTDYISTIAAPMPLTWMLPLLTYLLSFSAYFIESDFAPRILGGAALGSAALLAALSLGLHAPPEVVIVAAADVVLGLGCLLLHRELHALKPEADGVPRYFLTIAAGGFAGTALIAAVLPVLARRAFARYADVDAALALFAACAVMLYSPRLASGWRRYAVAAAALAAGLAVSRRAPAGVSNVCSLRNFYGFYRIVDDRASGLRTLSHGGTPHGVQALDPARRDVPLSYYGAGSPVAGIFALGPAASVGVVGLGAGELLSYARPGERWTVFELDPDVVAMARDYFSFVADSRASLRMVTGDSRRALEKEPASAFDLLVLDAFDGANVPFHLLTREAMETYRSKLKAGGLLVFHCSSDHFALRPVLAAGAAAAGMRGWSKDSGPEEEGPRGAASGLRASEWFVASVGPARAAELEAGGWSELTPRARDLWTDDYKNVLRALRLR